MAKLWISFFSLSLLFIAGCTAPLGEKTLYSEAFKDKKTWTIMVYMNGDNSLSNYTLPDINEMEKVDLGSEINLIVLWDRASIKTYLLKIKYDPSQSSAITSDYLTATINGKNLNAGASDEVNMMDPNTLRDFIKYCGDNYKADYYGLILWGHADGWRSTGEVLKGINDDTDDGASLMSNNMISQTLANPLLPVKINALGFDACLQGTLETLWGLLQYPSVSYLAASPDTIPGYGWNYALFLNYFKESYRRPADFVTEAVRAYKANYAKFPNTSLVAYDLSRLDISATGNGSWQDFFKFAKDNKAAENVIFNNVLQYSADFRDLYQYASLSNYPYKAAVIQALNQIILAGWKQGLGDGKYLSISYNKHGSAVDYDAIPMSSATNWNEFIDGN